ncbi:hypothetical protein BDV40DRAFT_310079 [Aspergillus tamarii]|uniref:FAD-binding PCMH-type domain-containing protein n=1 Tax=Aspergillus tamarii TaxID=41984 RepID=A0A5N6VAY7_ASPTM|nr:hypothetical protein BDV40DRAFT_310079 [Aspergillus tamarii]
MSFRLLFAFLFLGLATAGSSAVCLTLAKLLPGQVSFPNSTIYDDAVASYFFVQERLTPNCMVRPDSARDVAVVIKQVETTDGAILSVRGGGHSANVGFANSNTGITLDLRSLNHISVNGEGNVTSVGGGALWSEVYEYLDERGLAVLGGRVGTVGVGGLLTGGGLSVFSPRLGFASNNVANMEVVLASGDIVNANATSNADLFAALKAGQNNLGVVTRFDLLSFKQGSYWGGGIGYAESAAPAQLAAFAEFKTPANFDPDAEIEQSFLYYKAKGLRISSNNMFYSKPIVNASSLRRFAQIQPQISNTMRISNSSDFSKEMSEAQPANLLGVWATTTFKSSLAGLQDVYRLWNSSVTELSSVDGLVSSLTFQAVPPVTGQDGSIGTFGLAPGTHPEKDLVICLIANWWSNTTDSARMLNGTKEFIAAVEKNTEAQGTKVPFTYLNYAASWQDPIQSIGEEQVNFLKKVAAKYDPDGVFQTKVPGGFKISRVGS